ncbi:hypothetical protein ACWDUI_33935, partial [Streptosporangium sandarakinum]
MFKRISALVLVGVTTLAMAGCSGSGGSGGSSDGKIVMGFAQVGAESGWRTANTKSVQESAKSACRSGTPCATPPATPIHRRVWPRSAS